MKFGINQAISQTITHLSCIQLETHHPDFEIFDGLRLTQPLKLAIFKLILRINILSVSYEIAFR